MFSIPIDQITFEDIEEFCRTGARESSVLDYKVDFPKKLENTIAAFANTFGGHILIGIEETTIGGPAKPLKGLKLRQGLREQVVAIALDAISPALYPEVRVIPFRSRKNLKSPDRAIVLVRIHESGDYAHATNSGKDVYLRTDNISHPERRATVKEIEWLINKRKRSESLKSKLLNGARAHADAHLKRFRAAKEWGPEMPGTRVAIDIAPTFPRTELANPTDLYGIVQELGSISFNYVPHTFPQGGPMPVVDGVRYPDSLMETYYTYSEFNKFGLVYSELGFPWDADEAEDNLTKVSDIVVANLFSAVLAQSIRLYRALGYQGNVDINLTLDPAVGRSLFDSPISRYGRYESIAPRIEIHRTSTVGSIEDRLVDELVSVHGEFLWAFGCRIEGAELRRYIEKNYISHPFSQIS